MRVCEATEKEKAKKEQELTDERQDGVDMYRHGSERRRGKEEFVNH